MYQHVFVAGTFDRFHKGHEMLLATAFAEGQRVTVGITPDSFAQAAKKQSVAPFERRKQGVIQWLTHRGSIDKANCIAIVDQYEPAVSDLTIDALVVTAHNRKTGEEINNKRKQKGLPELTLIEAPLVSAQDGAPISSTRMRNGEIDATGKFLMPEAMRGELGKPLGILIPSTTVTEALAKQIGRTIVTVGDVVTKTFLAAGVTPTLAIIDLRVGRLPASDLAAFGAGGTHVKSGPGFISKEAVAAIGTWAESVEKNKKPHVIVIDGEEDLLVLPAILASPLDSLVYYGQPGQGVVEVEVTIEKKKEMTELLRKFEESGSE